MMNKLHTLKRATANIPLSPISQHFVDLYRHYTNPTDVDDEKEKEIKRIKSNASLEEPPTACCQSGCANCVFIVWAEALTEKMETAGPEIADKILKMVDDPSMRAYLEMELRIRGEFYSMLYEKKIGLKTLMNNCLSLLKVVENKIIHQNDIHHYLAKIKINQDRR